MTTWEIPKSCDNAPKQQWLVQWLQSWASGEPPTEPALFTFNGKVGSVSELDLSVFHKLHIHSVLTHGREGAIRAHAWRAEDNEDKQIELMLFAKFTLGKAPVMKELHVLVTI